MGSKTSSQRKEESTVGEAPTNGHQQSQSQIIQPPPPPPRPIISSSNHSPPIVLPLSQTSAADILPPKPLVEQEITHNPNAILASPIPEIYFLNDMIHIDSPEPLLSIDPSMSSYISATGEEVAVAYPEQDPNQSGTIATRRNNRTRPDKYLNESVTMGMYGVTVGRCYRCEHRHAS